MQTTFYLAESLLYNRRLHLMANSKRELSLMREFSAYFSQNQNGRAPLRDFLVDMITLFPRLLLC